MSKTKSKGKGTPSLKMKRFETRSLACKHVFDATERLELGAKLAASMQTHGEIEDQLKSITLDYKSRMKTVATEGDQYAARIRDGYEMREFKCIVYFNTATVNGKPKKRLGWKRIVHAATKEFVRDEPMSQTDLQSEMFEKEKIEKASKDAKEKKKQEAASPNVSGERKGDKLNPVEVPKVGDKSSTAATA